jgi:hypothetical protein
MGRTPFGRVKAKLKVVVEAMDGRLTTLNGAAKAELLSETETGSKCERPCYCEDAIHDRTVPPRNRTRAGAPDCDAKRRYLAAHLTTNALCGQSLPAISLG